jgi:glycosyltransferase involved in cell wall biosynthesis
MDKKNSNNATKIKYMKISVIIPCYNSEQNIIRVLLSIFSQTLAVHEVIVIDDGSTDQSYQLILNFKEQHNITNLKLVKQTNAGPASARNHGITLAEGDWIAFLDSDDIWDTSKIEIQQKYLLQNPHIILLGESLKKNKTAQIIQTISFNQLLLKNYFITSSVLVRKDILPNPPFDFNKKYSEDYKLWLEICHQHSCAILNIPLVKYSQNSNNLNSPQNLSSKLWKMEKGELENLRYCYQKRYINFFDWIILSVFSLVKYLRRLILKYIK